MRIFYYLPAVPGFKAWTSPRILKIAFLYPHSVASWLLPMGGDAHLSVLYLAETTNLEKTYRRTGDHNNVPFRSPIQE